MMSPDSSALADGPLPPDSPPEVATPPAVNQPLSEVQVTVRSGKVRPFYGRHPWVLDTAVQSVTGPAKDGCVVDLLSDKGRFIARGIYNSRSRLRVRLYSWNLTEKLDEAWWLERLERAAAMRRELGLDSRTGAARVVFSEADGLSGLVVDRYGEFLSVQVNALAIQVRMPSLIPLLVKVFRPRGIVLRNEQGITQVEGIEHQQGLIWGESPNGPVFIEEHGLRFGVDLEVGQKTGFYLDQRDNRQAAAAYLRGRNVLDLFCYSGGFSLAAAKAGATSCLGIDTSAKAVTLARANAELNGVPNVSFRDQDCFDALDEFLAAGTRFGGIILDPPKFTRSRKAVNEALRAYHRINRLAVDLLEPGGILVTCSCSGSVSREDFLYLLAGVAEKSGRDIQVLEQRGPAPDHPVSVTCLDNQYLKCFICRVW